MVKKVRDGDSDGKLENLLPYRSYTWLNVENLTIVIFNILWMITVLGNTW